MNWLVKIFGAMPVLIVCACSASAYPSGVASLSYSQLEDILKTHRVQSIDDLLPLLPEEFRKSYTLLYSSQSLQSEDVYPEFPRIVFYSPDSRLILALTKGAALGPALKDQDNLEVIEFDDQSSRFIFREFKFGAGIDPLSPPPEQNPKTCLTCHGSNPRPNWENYDFWPGGYGSVSRFGCSTFQSGTPEWSYYDRFLASGAGKGRYAFLGKGTPPVSADYPCPSGGTGEKTFSNALSTDPNADLGDALAPLNFQRIKAIFKSSPRFPQFQYLLAAIGKSCQILSLEDYFPEGYAQSNGFAYYGPVWNEVIAHEKLGYQKKLALFDTFNAASASFAPRRPVNFMDPADDDGYTNWQEEIPPVVQLKMIADRMGLDMDRWSMSFVASDSYDINFQSGAYLGTFYALFANDPALISLSCDELMEKSVEAFGN